MEHALDDEIRRVVAHIRRTGGKAKIQLTLNLSKLDFDGGIGIGHDLKITLPKEKTNDTLMWADRDNGLRDHSQDQVDLFDGDKDKPQLVKAETTVSPIRSA